MMPIIAVRGLLLGDSMQEITVKNWEKFQHYKNRKPPWIKLYRELLDNVEWRALSPFAGKLLIEIWLLVSESEEPGKIASDSKAIAWRLRYPENKVPEIDAALQELDEQGFITLASEMLATCKQDAIPERERETEESSSKSPTKNEEIFEKIWKAYPDKSGKSNALKAFLKHVSSGTDPKEVWAGLQRYKKQVEHKRANGFPTLNYQNGATWFNQKGWESEYNLPEVPAKGPNI